ncbi:MAG: arsenic efflux protein [Clostridiales bacterium]|nr:arsenic efflux protein [Clostridiales bacterium]
MADVLLDAFLDTLKLLPFLLVLYILIEALEHKTQIGQPLKALRGRAAPLVGAATGLIPLCGFSVMAAKLYEKRYITVGTLIAVFLATSDEAFLVLLTSPLDWAHKAIAICTLCAIKFVVGIGVGYALDQIVKRRKTPLQPLEEYVHEHEEAHAHMHDDEHEEEHGDHVHEAHTHEEFHTCEHRHKGNVQVYFLSPLLHALKISLFVFLVNLAFGSLFYLAGEENVIGFLQAGLWYQPLIASAIGMIPNCASSVVIAESYVMGGIAFGSMVAGLLTNAGLGFVVLFKRGRVWRENIILLALTFLIGIAVGYAVNGICLAAGL